MKTFEELGISEEILKAIKEKGYENPMPVQEEVIPYLLSNENDLVALAQTGTGKTAAYGLPVIQLVNPKERVPQALILSPTRELCLQIADDLNDYSKYIDDLKVLPVYGGSSIESQIRSLKRGVQIIVATPGRLIDLIERGVVHLDNVKRVILDEADEMLNMGFTDSINAIFEQIPDERLCLLFSATMNAEISRISKNYLHNAKEITIGTKNEGSANVSHQYFLVHAKDKYLVLKRIADFYPDIYGIIFCRTRVETQEIADKLIQDGYNADCLHGDLSQQQRDLTMQKFRQHRTQLLVATDVAARGLDVDDLTHVINYGLPDDVENYTHRSGRTGRAGKKGISIAIIHVKERRHLRDIEKIIKKTFEKGTIPTGKDICEKQLYNLVNQIEKVKVNEEEIASFLPEIYRKFDWLEKEDIIKRVVSLEFNRFLEYYKNAPEIEEPSEKRGADRDSSSKGKGGKRDSRDGKAPRSRKAEEGFTRMFINLGKTDNINPATIIDLINKHVKGRIEIGRIDLMKNFSFFEVEENATKDVLRGFSSSKAKYKDRRISVEVADAGDDKGAARGGSRKGDKGTRGKQNAESKPKKKKPSREERGYTEMRGPKKTKDDWKKFFE